MELDITIEVATESQLDEILPQFRAYQAYYSQLTGAGEEQTRTFLRELLRNPDRGFILLARSRSLVVGFATGFVTVSGVLASRLVHLGDLYIAPEYRGRTIGARLVDEVCAEAKRREISLVRWLSLAGNERLNAWYERLGAQGSDFKLFLKGT